MRVPITPFAGMLVAFIVTSGTAVDAQSHNIPGSGFEVGGWVGGAYADNETGRLSHCFVTAKYDDDSFLSFMGHPSGMLTFGFIVDPKASSSYAVLYIDDLPEIRKPIEIFENGVAIMEFDATRANLRVFQEGWWLTLDVGGWKKTYKLRGSRNALNALDDCMLRYRFHEGPTRASEPPPDTGNIDVSRPEPDQTTDDQFAGGTGTGFLVTSDGHVLTNAHVVPGCTAIFVNGQVATIVDVSETYDLALLKIDVPEDTPFAAFSELPARLNSDISVSGFPYAGLLGGLNITRGTVSSLSGLGGDVAKMQITAPIQRGNSGGPVFATNGGVIGVVVEKIDALLVAEFLDDLPQNVNFAIRSEIAKLFLLQNHVEPHIADRAEDMKPEDLAELAVKVTKFVECSGD